MSRRTDGAVLSMLSRAAQHRPITLAAVAFAAGILIGKSPIAFAVLAAVALGALILLAATGRAAFRLAAILAAFASAGSFRQAIQYAAAPRDVARFATGRYVEVRGRLAEEAQVGSYYWTARLSATSVSLGDGVVRACDGVVIVRAACANGDDVPSYGERVRVRGTLEPLEEPGNPGAGRSAEVFRRQGVSCRLECRHRSAWGREQTDGDLLSRVVATALRLRTSMADTFRRYTSPDRAELLTGIVLGGHGGLPPDVRESFRRAGILHIVAASGANVALVIALVFFLTPAVRFVPRLRSWLAVLGAAAYAIAAGSQPAVVRAAVMASVFAAAPAFDRDRDGPCALAFAALAALAYDPGNLFDVGFELSFAIVAGTVAFWPSWETILNRIAALPPEATWVRKNAIRLWRGWLSVLALSAIAGAFSAPLTAQTFNTVSLVGVVSNALVAPAVAILLPAAFVGWFVATFSHAGGGILCATLLDPLARWITAVADLTSGVSFASINVRSPGWPLIGASYLLLGLGAINLRRMLSEATA